MCEHRRPNRWTRIWERYLVAVIGGFAALEGIALFTEGEDATLSAYVWRLAGAHPATCRHTPLGRAAIVAAAVWATAHLGWGVLGVVPAHRNGECHGVSGRAAA